MSEELEILDDRYVLLRQIHQGRRCTVHQARHRHTQRTVAVKVLQLAQVLERFERDALMAEARALSEVRHVCVPDVLDAGLLSCSIAGAVQPYLVMEMIEGRSLAGLLAARGSLEVPLAVVAAQAMAAGLRACHRRGLIHQDVRPGNVLLPLDRSQREPETRGAPIKLVDFDSAVRSLLDGGAARERAYQPNLAPEQLHGGMVDARTDVFGVGVVLYECLSGALPYPPDGQFREAPVAVRERRNEVSAKLDRVVMRAIAVAPSERFRDMSEMLGGLEAALQEAMRVAAPQPPSTPPVRPISVAPPVTAPSEDSRRGHARAAYLTPVRVFRSEGTVIDCTSEDIAEGGMLLLGPQILGDGEDVEARFALPVTGTMVNVRGVARWGRESHDGGACTGLSFDDLTEEARAEIAKYIEFFAVS